MPIDMKMHISEIAKRYNLKGVYLFGSRARNEENKNSDYDLIVDTEDSSVRGLLSLGALYEDLKAALGRDLDLMTLKSLLEYESDPESEILSRNIRKDMVQIYNRSF
jgi:predicted nucleotidyltransferase